MKLFSQELLDELTAKAAASPRLRANHNIHNTAEDPVQRFFIVAQRDTYFRPHRHLTRSELALVLRGRFDVLTFDAHGVLTQRYEVGSDTGNLGFETPVGTWHTLISRTDGSSFLEIKQGPYDPVTAVEFAPWAPPEGHESVPLFQRWLREAEPGSAVADFGLSDFDR